MAQERPLPDFHNQDGWFGADAAYSIQLDKNHSLWLFDDTFVGNRSAKLRNENKDMVRNTVGISTCHAGGRPCSMKYFWQKQYSDKPRSFFDTGTDDVWYWPLDAVLYEKKLFMSVLVLRTRAGAKPTDVFAFEVTGTKLATITNVLASPKKWHVSYADLTNENYRPGPSFVVDGNYVVWYTQKVHSEGNGYMIVMRVPKGKMGTPSTAWEYLKNDGSWAKGLPEDDAMHVIDQAITEMSVRYHANIHKWVAIVPGPGFPTAGVDLRVADFAIGPWSQPQKVFEFPEMKRTNPGYDKDTYCYAAKEHIEFTDSKIAFTYVCNSMVVPKVVANEQLYRPRVVFLDLPH